MEWTIRTAGPDDAGLLVAAGDALFDHPVTPDGAAAFLDDPAQVLVIACAEGRVLGFASGAFVRHPDKPLSLFVNEVSVHESARRRGIGRALVEAIVAHGRGAGCGSAWVLTETDNLPARGLYRRVGGAETDGIVMYDWADDD